MNFEYSKFGILKGSGYVDVNTQQQYWIGSEHSDIQDALNRIQGNKPLKPLVKEDSIIKAGKFIFENVKFLNFYGDFSEDVITIEFKTENYTGELDILKIYFPKYISKNLKRIYIEGEVNTTRNFIIVGSVDRIEDM